MPDLPEYISDHKSDAARMVFKLVRVALPVPQCMTTADIPISYGGETYIPTAGLKVGGVRSSEVDQAAVAANITIGNADGRWGEMWASLSPADRHPEITVEDAWVDPAEPWLGPRGVRTRYFSSAERPRRSRLPCPSSTRGEKDTPCSRGGTGASASQPHSSRADRTGRAARAAKSRTRRFFIIRA